jgi:hypothetical protein
MGGARLAARVDSLLLLNRYAHPRDRFIPLIANPCQIDQPGRCGAEAIRQRPHLGHPISAHGLGPKRGRLRPSQTASAFTCICGRERERPSPQRDAKGMYSRPFPGPCAYLQTRPMASPRAATMCGEMAHPPAPATSPRQVTPRRVTFPISLMRTEGSAMAVGRCTHLPSRSTPIGGGPGGSREEGGGGRGPGGRCGSRERMEWEERRRFSSLVDGFSLRTWKMKICT